MRDVFVIGDNIYSPLGSSTAENFQQLVQGNSGICLNDDELISPSPFYASLFDKSQTLNAPGNGTGFTRFEQLLIASISGALQEGDVDPTGKETILIISSTKGNISLLESEEPGSARSQRISLPGSAQKLAEHFHFSNKPLVISNACISGILAILTAMRLIQSGRYTTAVVAGADVVSTFVLTGFQSFQAISPGACKPFDAARNGINLGEGAGTMILSSRKANDKSRVRIAAGAVTNDANHISGPSRTGKELGDAIAASLRGAGLRPNEIDFISAHGTATIYNDEMESLAVDMSGLASVPLNSLKGYYGHTLGAAGLIETVISAHSMRESLLIPTKGYATPGVSKPINVCSTLVAGKIDNLLKTASGFGGCNAALVLSKQ